MTIFTVTTLNDVVDSDDGLLSLREALSLSETSAGADTIAFDASLLTGGKGTITTNATLAIADLSGQVTIDGDVDNDGIADITIDGQDSHRVFEIWSDVAMTGLVVTGGNAVGDGGGILVGHGSGLTGRLEFSDGAVTDSTASGSGGGIRADGSLTLTDSTVSGNSAAYGGGVWADGATILNVAILDNAASVQTGGLHAQGGTSVENATIAGNAATTAIGGLHLIGGSFASHITVTGNSDGGAYADGVAQDDSDISYSLILGNGSTDFRSEDGSGTDSVVGALVGSVFGLLDFLLGPLFGVDPDDVFAELEGSAGIAKDNGGSVFTVALSDDPYNPAIDPEGSTGTADARGYLTVGTRDLGAYESLAVAPGTSLSVGLPIGTIAFEEDTAISWTVPDGAFVGGAGTPLLSIDAGEGLALPDWLTFDVEAGILSGTPPKDYNGVISLRLLASDGDDTVTQVIELDLTPVDDAPVAAHIRTSTSDTRSVVIDLESGAFDADGDPIEIAAVAGMSAGTAGTGTVTLDDGATIVRLEDGTYLYTPPPSAERLASKANGVPGESIDSTFTYTVSDGHGETATASVTVEVMGHAGNDDVVRGTAGADTLFGRRGDDRVYGRDGDDEITGNFGFDIIHGGRGDDQIYGHRGNDRMYGASGDDVMLGGRGHDRMDGGRGADTLRGVQGSDVIHGRDGADRLRGGDGDDVLKGGRGRDELIGGEGKDALTGGGGRDVFVFAGAFGTDTVSDWGRGRDRIDLTAANTDLGALAISRHGDDAVIKVAIGATVGKIVLEDTDVQDLSASDFLF